MPNIRPNNPNQPSNEGQQPAERPQRRSRPVLRRTNSSAPRRVTQRIQRESSLRRLSRQISGQFSGFTRQVSRTFSRQSRNSQELAEDVQNKKVEERRTQKPKKKSFNPIKKAKQLKKRMLANPTDDMLLEMSSKEMESYGKEWILEVFNHYIDGMKPQIEEREAILKDRFKDQEKRIKELEDKIVEIEDDLANIEGSDEEVETRIKDLEAQIKSYEREISDIDGNMTTIKQDARLSPAYKAFEKKLNNLQAKRDELEYELNPPEHAKKNKSVSFEEEE